MWHNAPFIQKMKERLKDGTPLLRKRHVIILHNRCIRIALLYTRSPTPLFTSINVIMSFAS